MQGVLRREWQALFKQDNAAEDGFSARPKGSPQISQDAPKEVPLGCKAWFAGNGALLSRTATQDGGIWGLLIS